MSDDAGNLVGIVTDGDLRRLLQRVKQTELETLTANSIMTQNPVVVSRMYSPTMLCK